MSSWWRWWTSPTTTTRHRYANSGSRRANANSTITAHLPMVKMSWENRMSRCREMSRTINSLMQIMRRRIHNNSTSTERILSSKCPCINLSNRYTIPSLSHNSPWRLSWRTQRTPTLKSRFSKPTEDSNLETRRVLTTFFKNFSTEIPSS